MKALRYIDSLDTLRAIAVLAVMLLHASYGFFIGGWVGVNLFFVISGYLITSILLKEYATFQDVSFKNFYIRRALKLFPPLIITLILANILWEGGEIWATLGGLFYFTNIINAPGNLPHLWSLSVEEHFYLFWPVALVGLILIRKRNPFVSLVILIIAVSSMKIIFTTPIVNGLLIIDSRFTLFNIDGLMMGALIAFMKAIKFKNAEWILISLLAGFLFVLFKVDLRWLNYQRFGFILVNLLCFGIVLMAVNYSSHWLFSSNLLKWIGKRSYGLYLYHFPIFIAMEVFKHPQDKFNFALVFIARFAFSFILAAISYRYLEAPILKFKHRYVPVLKSITVS